MKVSEKISYNHSPIVLMVAMVAGLGVILMIIALAVGVIQGTAADSNAVGLLLAGGFVLFLLGAVAWFMVTQPQKHFDDISKPIDTDPHHGHHDQQPASENHAETQHQPAGH